MASTISFSAHNFFCFWKKKLPLKIFNGSSFCFVYHHHHCHRRRRATTNIWQMLLNNIFGKNIKNYLCLMANYDCS